MIGPRAYPLVGPLVGPIVGAPAADEGDAFAAFRDSESGKLCPASDDDWTELELATSNPTSLWLFQEASGNFADSIGARTLTPGGIGGPQYQQAVAGWSRLEAQLNTGNQATLATTIDNANASDILLLLYVRLRSGITGTRQIVEHPTFYAEFTATPRFHANAGTPEEGTVDPGTTVHAMVLKNWIGNSRGLFTEDEALLPDEFVAAGTLLRIGSSSGATAPLGLLYGAMWEGTAARMSDAQIKTMLETLGWTVAW